jgi:hypothetical protein
MAKTYRPYVAEQDLLLPPSLREWLPENHLAFFVSDLIDQLDLSAITSVYEGEERGYRPGRFSVRWWRPSRSGCWQLATSRTSGPSPILARRT